MRIKVWGSNCRFRLYLRLWHREVTFEVQVIEIFNGRLWQRTVYQHLIAFNLLFPLFRSLRLKVRADVIKFLWWLLGLLSHLILLMHRFTVLFWAQTSLSFVLLRYLNWQLIRRQVLRLADRNTLILMNLCLSTVSLSNHKQIINVFRTDLARLRTLWVILRLHDTLLSMNTFWCVSRRFFIIKAYFCKLFYKAE